MSQMIQVSELTWPREQTTRPSSSSAPLLVSALVLSDIVVSIGSLLLAYVTQVETVMFTWSSEQILPGGMAESFEPVWNLLLLVPLVRLGALWQSGLYQLRGGVLFGRDLVNVFKAASIGTVILILMTLMIPGVFEFGELAIMRPVLFLDWMYAFGGLLVLRLLMHIVQVAARRQGRNIIPAVIVGDGDVARMCLEEINGKPPLGYQLMGVLTASDEVETSSSSGLPVIGTIHDLPSLIRQCGIQEVFITDSQLRPQTLFETIVKCGRTHPVQYHVVPNLFNCLPQKTDFAQIGVVPTVKLFEEPITGLNRHLKRGIDLLASSVLLLVTSPLWLILSLLIKRESPGPVFYKQERVGMDGHVFLVYKFRSMRADADDQAHREAVRTTLHGGNNGTGDSPLYGKVKDDDRITRVGRFIRRFSLDELPQLINVFRGEMSLVGPRPLPIYQVEEEAEHQRARHHIKPGLTGLWQVSGRNRLPFDEMVQLDISYIENWSLWLDLKIMLKTPAVMLFGQTEN